MTSENIVELKKCGTHEEEYFPKLVEFLGNMSCNPGIAESQRFIATGIARRIYKIDPWKGKGGESAREQLAKKLLADDCAGKDGLDGVIYYINDLTQKDLKMDNIDMNAKIREILKKIAKISKPPSGEP